MKLYGYAAIVKVLRLTPGADVELIDGSGAVYFGVVVSVDRQVELRIEKVVEAVVAVKTVIVYQAVLGGDKMDTVVQKCTELGVNTLIPFESSRCQGTLKAGQRQKKHERWQRICLSACKQSLRPQRMEIAPPMSYNEVVKSLAGKDHGLRIMFWEKEKKQQLGDIPEIETNSSISLLIGPEGGFSLDEYAAAIAGGFVAVSLGSRILRAETATLTAVSIVQYPSGNL